MTINTTLLVVVDAQKGFLASVGNREAAPKIIELVSSWQAVGGPILFTRMFNFPGSPLEILVDYTLMQSPPETDLIDELQPFVREVLDKRVYSIFNEQGSAFVRSGGFDTLAFCGFDTEACVLKSAFDAFDLGYRPLIISDAVASSFGQEKHQAGLSVAEAVLGRRQIMDVQTFLKDFAS